MWCVLVCGAVEIGCGEDSFQSYKYGYEKLWVFVPVLVRRIGDAKYCDGMWCNVVCCEVMCYGVWCKFTWCGVLW